MIIDRPRLGVVGCGGHMYDFLYNGLKWAPHTETVAACDVNAERLDRFACFHGIARRYDDHRAMLANERLDAVIVATGHDSHFAIARASLEAGVHVFVEKTPTATSAQAEELAALQAATGRFVMVGFNRRFMTSYAMAKEIAGRSEFGPAFMYQSHFHAAPYRSDAFLRVNHIIHHLDLARFLLGEINLTHVEPLLLDERRACYAITFRSESGCVGSIQSGSVLDDAYPMERVEILGDRRSIVIDNVKGLVYNRPPHARVDRYERPELVDGCDALAWNPNEGRHPRYSHHGYEAEIHAFIACVRDGRRPTPDIADSVKTMRLLDQLDALSRLSPRATG